MSASLVYNYLGMIIAILSSILAGLVLYFGISALIANGVAMSSRVPIDKTPKSLGLTYQDVSFRSRVDNVLLRGWFMPANGNRTIIVMHGGKQSRADATMQLMELCGDLVRKGFNVLTFDRRGCGQSEASRCKVRARLDRDFGGAVDYVHNRNDIKERIFLLGISMGAVAAFTFAHKEEGISGIVSDSCFSRASEMAGRTMSRKCKLFKIFAPSAVFMGRILFGLPKDDAIDRVGSIKCPILFINGAEDKDIPTEDTNQLFKASNNPLDEMWIVPGTGHSQAYKASPTEYINKVTTFINNNCSAF